MPTSASTSGSSARHQRTITCSWLARELDEGAGGARLRAAGGADEKDLAFELEPATRASTSVPAARSFSTDEREMNVTP